MSLSIKMPYYWLHCTSFSLDHFAAFEFEHPLETFMKNFDYSFELCAHINSVHFHGLLCLLLLLCPRGIQVSPSTPLILLNWQRNHLHHVYWFLVTAALTCESGIELFMSLRTFLCGLSQTSKRREGTEERGVDVSSIVNRSHSVL